MSAPAQTTTIRILLFGPMAGVAGADSLELEIDGSATTCSALCDLLTSKHPHLARMLPAHRFAVNSQFVRDDQRVTPADEVALIGMVSGG